MFRLWFFVIAAMFASSLLVVGLASEKARAAGDPILLGAGDIASCQSSGDEATAELLASTGGTVAALGDTVYPDGTAAQFRDCYGPSWGRFKARTRPAVGNHEYSTAGAQPYFEYFGAAAGPSGRGYYSYDRGSWHVVVLNSNCSEVSCAAAPSRRGGSGPTWPQMRRSAPSPTSTTPASPPDSTATPHR
jgi:hypothetical protein